MEIADILWLRIRRFETFKAAGITTPRFTAQLESTINIYREMMKSESPNPKQSEVHIEELLNSLDDYWARLFSTFDKATLLFQRMAAHRGFLEQKLFEDYLNRMPFVLDRSAVAYGWSKGNSTDRERAAQTFGIKIGSLDKLYEERVTAVLYEMMIDPANVQRKFEAAAARNGESGSDIQPLIDNCRWTDLAAALYEDRILAQTLFPPFASLQAREGSYPCD
jgi:hypothetical protein